MAEHQLPKLNTRVRFPSSAPRLPAEMRLPQIRAPVTDEQLADPTLAALNGDMQARNLTAVRLNALSHPQPHPPINSAARSAIA